MKKSLNFLISITLFVFHIFAGAAHASEREERWSVTGTELNVTAANCINCEEDIDILVQCNAMTRKVDLLLYAFANDLDNKSIDVTFLLMNEERTISASVVEFGLVGHTPIVSIKRDDPLLTMLKKAEFVDIRVNTQTVRISLLGSNRALSKFATQCENGMLFSQTVLSQTAPTNDENGLFWFTGDGYGKGSAKILQYAIPQSDAAVMIAICNEDHSKNINIEIYGTPVNSKTDSAASISLKIDDEITLFEGAYFSENDEYAGIRFSISRSDSIWLNMGRSNGMEINIDNVKIADLGLEGGRAAITEFTKACYVSL